MQELDVNKVLLIGSIDKEPVVRYTQNNTAICQLRVKTTERYTSREGEQRESFSTHTVVVWGQKGERIKDQLHINSRVYVEGNIRNRSYQDDSGNTKWVTEISAQTVFPLGGGAPAVQQGVQSGYGQPSPSYSNEPSTYPAVQQGAQSEYGQVQEIQPQNPVQPPPPQVQTSTEAPFSSGQQLDVHSAPQTQTDIPADPIQNQEDDLPF